MTYLLNKDGTSQADRFPNALRRDYFNVDEMRFEDLLAMGSDLARILKFTNLDNEHEGTWEDFFTADVAVIIARILAMDLGKFESGFADIYLRQVLPGAEARLDIPNYQLACHINDWHRALKTAPTPVGRALHQLIEHLIKDKLGQELQELIHLLRPYDDRIEARFESEFESVWFESAAGRLPDGPPLGRAQSLQRLRSNFYAFLNAAGMLRKSAADHIAVSLQSRSHSPAMGLYMVFLKLYLKVTRKLNRFTGRHLDFYYHDVLGLRPREVLPDSAYLVLTPDPVQRKTLIRRGTGFTGGMDAAIRNLVYTASNEILLRHTTINSLYTLHFDHDRLSSPENELGLATRATTNHIPVIKEEIQQNGELKAWPALGAPTDDTEQRRFKDAEFGFAVASPILFLKEGMRKIDLSFKLASPAGEKREFLDHMVNQYAEITNTSQSDAFFRLFRHMFAIYLTTAAGWLKVDEYLPLTSLVDEGCAPDCLKIQIRLSPEVVPITSCSSEIHGAQYPADLPVIRLAINPAANIYPYSLLKAVSIQEIEIAVDVHGIRDVLLYNDLGRLDPNNVVTPFGPTPSIGSAFIVGCRETACKHLVDLSLDIVWDGLPSDHGGFAEYYRAYELPIDNEAFEARIAVLQSGRWEPYHIDSQSRVKLFKSETDGSPGEGSRRINQRIRLSCAEAARLGRQVRSVPIPATFGYNAMAKDGFFKVTLTAPEEAFGHKAYPHILTRVLTTNARLKKERLHKPPPPPPYTPQFNSMALNYKAVSTINIERMNTSDETFFQEKVYHIHPFGIERLSPATHREIRFLPQYDAAGHLFIGLEARELAGLLTLFFHMREDSFPRQNKAAAKLKWYYLSSNRWIRLENDNVLSDTTHGFLSSGIVTVNIPEDIDRQHTVMPSNIYWIAVTADEQLETLCSLYSVYPQALKVVRKRQDDREPDVNHMVPAGTILESSDSIPGIKKINQIIDSFGGRPPESGEMFKTRIGERLKHKNRAVVPWDYERLILERFPELFKVKCFANMVDSRQPQNRTQPGHVLIVVIPDQKDSASTNLKPMANERLLREVNDFTKDAAAPFVKIRVRNPAYEEVQIRCSVTFRSAAGKGYLARQLNQAIHDYLSPWSESGYRARFGWCIREDDMKSFLRSLDDVEYVTNFSMLRIAGNGRGMFNLFDTVAEDVKEIHPLYPWSIAIPARKHFIETMAMPEVIDPRVTGVDELEIGSTFIISGK